MGTNDIDLSSLHSAVRQLERALSKPPANDLAKAGCIQVFEYTFELSWKMMRRHIIWANSEEDMVLNRKDIFREAAALGLIDDPEKWFGYQKARNTTSHLYDESKAQGVFESTVEFLPDVRMLLERLIDRHA